MHPIKHVIPRTRVQSRRVLLNNPLLTRLISPSTHSYSTIPTNTTTNNDTTKSIESKESEDPEETNLPPQDPLKRGTLVSKVGKTGGSTVILSPYLHEAITRLLSSKRAKQLRPDAFRIFDSLRSTGSVSKLRRQGQLSKQLEPLQPNASSSTALEPHIISYGPRESIAYAAVRMVPTYAAVYTVLKELQKRVPNLSVKSLLDFGCGTGTGIWAARDIFGYDQVQNILGVDISQDMLDIASALLETPTETVSSRDLRDCNVEFQRYLSFDTSRADRDLVISAFTLTDLMDNPSVLKSTVQNLWNQTKDTLVIVDRGTPEGFKIVAQARQWILDMEGESHVVAPCPHDGACPILKLNHTQFWCHFSQRVQRPSKMMHVKKSEKNWEDVKYSYVILRRGSRPVSLPLASTIDPSLDTQALLDASYNWPRLTAPPIKNKGHVILDYCSPSGYLERTTVSKRKYEKPVWRDARKARWGDLWGHEVTGSVSRREAVVEEGSDLVTLKTTSLRKERKEKVNATDKTRRRNARVNVRKEVEGKTSGDIEIV